MKMTFETYKELCKSATIYTEATIPDAHNRKQREAYNEVLCSMIKKNFDQERKANHQWVYGMKKLNYGTRNHPDLCYTVVTCHVCHECKTSPNKFKSSDGYIFDGMNCSIIGWSE